MVSKKYAYVGCRTTKERQARGTGLAVFSVDKNDSWSCIQSVSDSVPNPSFLCEYKGKFLFVIHGDFGHVSSYAITPGDGTLKPNNQVSVEGANPVHLIISRSGKWLLVVNYATGNMVSIPIQSDGGLNVVVSNLKFEGRKGPHPEQKGSHPHQITYNDRFDLYCVPDKGLDRVSYVKLDETTGQLTIEGQTEFPPGAGVRHMAIHPSGKYAYVVGELNSSLYLCSINEKNGHLQVEQTVSTVPEGFASANSGAGIVCTKDHVFISNRGHDSIVRFEIDTSGKLSSGVWVGSNGNTPRFICLNDRNDSLLVANEASDSIYTLPLNFISNTNATLVANTGSPVCIVFNKVN